MAEYTMIISEAGGTGIRAEALVRGLGQPKAEIVQALPVSGVIILKVPGYTESRTYQPTSYQIYTINRVISPIELVCTKLVEFEGRGVEIYHRMKSLSWHTYPNVKP